MPAFQFYQPINVRYGDLDPQGHVNNASYLTYLEEARIGYIKQLGLWTGGSFLDIGIIVADAQVTFRMPLVYGVQVQVGVKVESIGGKSLKMAYSIEDHEAKIYAKASTVLVAFDYHSGKTILVPDDWRSAINSFEGINV